MISAISRQQQEAGFSLLEVLVAFAVLALILGVILQIFSGGLRIARLTEQYGRATLLAESKLAGLGMETPLQEGQSEGAFEFDPDYRWQLTVQPYAWGEPGMLDTLQVRPFQVTVAVSWGEEPQSRSISLTTLRLAPRDE